MHEPLAESEGVRKRTRMLRRGGIIQEAAREGGYGEGSRSEST